MPEKTLEARTVVRAGVAHHTNLNFGGRFGHSAIYHALHKGRVAADQETAARLDEARDFWISRGYTVRVVGCEVDPSQDGPGRRGAQLARRLAGAGRGHAEG
jgi:hypothetical protein